MKPTKTLWLFVLALIFLSPMAWADQILPSIDDKYISIVEDNPTRDAGYVVGDKLERTITLTVKSPFQLIGESLPIIGYEHRYRGKTSGVELVNIDTNEESLKGATRYTIHLTYQVFKAGRVAKPAILRGEILKFRNLTNKEVLQYRVPHFNFRISPLSVYGEVNLKNEMSPFVPPFIISTAPQYRIIQVAGIVLALSILGLIYILGASTWLPRMGGPFAKAYKGLKKTQNQEDALPKAISLLHQAIDHTAGNSVFARNLDEFLASRPKFSIMRSELDQFFKLSQHTYFDPNLIVSINQPPLSWLKSFCRKMRDCERGLAPEVNA